MSECGKSCIVIEQAALKPSPFPAVISAGVIEIERRQGIVTLIMMRPASNILRLPSSNNLKPPSSSNLKSLSIIAPSKPCGTLPPLGEQKR